MIHSAIYLPEEYRAQFEEYWVAAEGVDALTRWQLYRGVQSLLGLKSEIRMGQTNVFDISGPDDTHNVIRNNADLGGVFGLIREHLDKLLEATREGKKKHIEKVLQETDKLSKQVPLKAWHSLLGHTGSMSSVGRKA